MEQFDDLRRIFEHYAAGTDGGHSERMSLNEFWEVVKQTLEKHDYCCVKNSKNTGIIQCNEGKAKRWFIGHLCDWKNIENILGKINLNH